MRLIAKAIRISHLNFIAIDLQLYNIFKIMRVSFFGTQCTLMLQCLIFVDKINLLSDEHIVL